MIQFLFSDREYYQKIKIIAIPLILQNLINVSVNLIDTLMLSSLGDAALGSVNIATQFNFYFFNMLIFGFIAGGAILNAQYWGTKDTANIHRVMGIQFIGCTAIGLFFAVLTRFHPEWIMRFYSKDPEVILNGGVYLRTLAPSFVLVPISNIFSNAHRCTGNTRTPMIIYTLSLGLKVILNWLLIFGQFGLPALGVQGAAISTLIARAVECVLFVLVTYLKRAPIAGHPRAFFNFRAAVTKLALRNMLPVMLNEGIWGFGTNVYSSIYANISTASIAAVAAVNPIDNFMFTIFLAVGDACAVMIGHQIGKGRPDKAYEYGKRSILLTMLLSFGLGTIVFLSRGRILSIYSLSDEAASAAFQVLGIMAATIWARTTSYILIIGILRAGGDVRFCLVVDSGASWLIGIPAAWIMAFVFHLPIEVVYLGVMLQEFSEFVLFFLRFRSRKWLNNLTLETSEALSPALLEEL